MDRVAKGLTLVVGLGVSGRAICRHLSRLNVPYMVADTRAEPPGLDDFRAAHPAIDVHCGSLAALDLTGVAEVVVSPGLDPRMPGLKELADQLNPHTGEPMVVGEIALFVRSAKAPVAAITGSNAKSTVTTLLGDMATAAGVDAAVGGNLGTPALDLLASHPDAQLYILELSSFQLETTPRLGARCAAFLNLSEDHLDRHGDMHSYRAAKQRIFIGAESAVVNADEPPTWPTYPVDQVAYFSQRAPEANEWGLAFHHDKLTLMQGSSPWLAIDELKIAGQHNYLNALAALAMGQTLGFAAAPMCNALREFKGLEHRSEVIAQINGVTWVNDTKGTNVGATLAAINGIGATLEGRLILLAGGIGKGADFTPLAAPLSKCARHVLLFGLDAPRLADALIEHVSIQQVEDLTQAMQTAFELAQPGDCVLLSPACSSLDQFANYPARGEAFRRWVLDKASTKAGEAL
ncbi:UDP-N-acetylmuramoyl-L-alanine--D-glutamate ligase [Halomonas sp. SpR8]|uniref:UDP-N-acetylmuramoyl-L-alanine--D-glutamate ligase n=1 Tax=Halomonas sp. SpR8 TaxID=3050463 RepID=UPI0027E3E1C9|nr:UDP-N-acetylmuramoyl-L-alanine--D-glutamate ligase [Halomonas sp. SpR8]MDQ7727477.1 UDP-N-acetylmuramoyl-L-alanine--D-glutamate ligase [Halomonas sp. SpR8]